MFGEEKNLKDPKKDSLKDSQNMPAPYQVEGANLMSVNLSYKKTDKLITALYMVTDIIDKDEPLRKKLRTIGIEIISDINSNPPSACSKVSEIMSFLGIASAMNIVSEMNCNILKKEFAQLDQAIRESSDMIKKANRQVNLSDFFQSSFAEDNKYEEVVKPNLAFSKLFFDKGHKNYKGQTKLPKGNSIGVQKGSTLMKALSKVNISTRRTNGSNINSKSVSFNTANNFETLKRQRRDEISKIIQKADEGATITDIRNSAYGSLLSCGEKTLQRELVSMIKDGILNKTGEKRWSRYFLKK